ncbi:8935_t:CDS:2, partial [Entrophospora sp. SA101]
GISALVNASIIAILILSRSLLVKEKIVNYECDTDEEDLDYDSHNFLEKGVKNNIDLYGSNDESSDKDDDIEINEDKEKKSKNTSRKRIKKNYKD